MYKYVLGLSLSCNPSLQHMKQVDGETLDQMTDSLQLCDWPSFGGVILLDHLNKTINIIDKSPLVTTYHLYHIF